jgi:hypothetical protein
VMMLFPENLFALDPFEFLELSLELQFDRSLMFWCGQ